MIGHLMISLVVLAQTSGGGDWKPYKSAKGKYSVSMPTKPTEKKRILAVSGRTIELTSATSRKGLATYVAVSGDLNGADPEAALKAAQADIVALSKGELKDEKDATLGEIPGRELAIEIPKKVVAGGANQTTRLCVAGGRVYELIAIVPSAKFDALADDIGTFFDSFKATGVDPATAVNVAPAATVTAEAKSKSTGKVTTTKAEKPKSPAVKADPNSPAAQAGSMIGSLAGLNPLASKPATTPPAAASAANAPEAAANAGAPKGLGPEWKIFTPPGGGFSAAMPGEPKERKVTSQTPKGPMVLVHYAIEQEKDAFIVGAIPIPPGAKAAGDGDAMLQAGKKDAMANTPGAKLVTEQKVMHQGFPGLDITIEVPKGPRIPDGLTKRVRMVIAKGKFFQIQAIHKSLGDANPGLDIAAYFDTLKIE